MAKKRKRRVTSPKISETPKFSGPGQEYSFDLDSITCIACVGYGIREAIVEKAKAKSKVKKCIPKSVILSVLKELKLDQYLPDKD
jgi:hypothetical protein